MRDIKFRGKSIETGEWVYGDLIQLHDGRKFIINNKYGACLDEKGNFINTERPFVHEVIPESVGQFTGLKDKSSVEIYEGDIVKYKAYTVDGDLISYIDEVVFLYQQFTFSDGLYFDRPISDSNYISFEVIGNIYENPELVEGEK